jgi:hypothetical protein
VRKRSRVALIAIALLAGIAALTGGLAWKRARALNTTAGLVERLPTEGATVLHIDVSALRTSGLLDKLAGSNAIEEPEYRAFVERTGFDYRTDLDTVTAAFGGDHSYFLLRGRFDWAALKAHVEREGGSCRNLLCGMQGSKPDRQISFAPLRRDVMAMAAGPKPDAAAALSSAPDSGRPIDIPPEPLWISIAPASLRKLDQLPPGTRAFARAMQGAGQVRISLGRQGSAFELKLMVECASGASADSLSAQLRQTTETLRNMISREQQTPNPADLSGVLTAGVFRSEGSRVYGSWPVAPVFFNNILGGGSD